VGRSTNSGSKREVTVRGQQSGTEPQRWEEQLPEAIRHIRSEGVRFWKNRSAQLTQMRSKRRQRTGCCSNAGCHGNISI